MRPLQILACLGLLACVSAELRANEELETLASLWRNQQRKIEHARCEIGVTRAAIRQAADWHHGPYYSIASSELHADPAARRELTGIASRIIWLKAGVREYREQRFLGGHETAESEDVFQTSVLIDDLIGLTVSVYGNRESRGVLWEDGERLDSVPIPFDFLLDTSPRGALALDQLVERVGNGLKAEVRHEQAASSPRIVITFSSVSPAEESSIEYTLLPKEGHLPEKIVLTTPAGSKNDPQKDITTIHVVKRKQLASGAWVPWKMVRVYGSTDRASRGVEILQVRTWDEEPLPLSELKLRLPKSTIIRLGNQLNSLFQATEGEDVDLARLRALIAQAKELAAGQRRTLTSIRRERELPPLISPAY